MGIFDFFKKKHTNSQPANIYQAVRTISSNSSNQGGYWRNFKLRKPDQAEEIQQVVDFDMGALSESDAFEIVTTFLRWHENAGVPINKLKENFLDAFYHSFDGLNVKQAQEKMPGAINLIKTKRLEEAKQFGIAPEHTCCHFMWKWVEESEAQFKDDMTELLMDFMKHSAISSMENQMNDMLQKIHSGQEIEAEEDGDSMIRNMAKKMGLKEGEIPNFIEEVKASEKELNLAPDISKLDREENRLISLAEEGVNFISKHYNYLNEYGCVEALLYCTTCLINLPTNYENELDMDVKEDRYFLLLHDRVIFKTGSRIENVASFINSRIDFYNEEKRKLANSPYYTPMFIYNAFYINPLCEKPGVLNDFSEPPFELFRLQEVLQNLEQFFRKRKQEIL